ncbi:MAG: M3 family oligoendopeptidase [Desulfomonile tiedjei]|nr:M3 family oligoendopeptidase [Desulfomonile tiedjei]
MFDLLPNDAKAVMQWSWTEIEPYYDDLVGRSVTGDTVSAFLRDWTRLSELIDEAYSRLMVATTVNTADQEAERRYHAFLDEVYPPVEQAEQKLRQKLLESGLTPEGFRMPLSKMRWESEIFREANLTLLVQDHKLSTQYDKIMGGQTVQWNGREVTLVQLRPFFQSKDRSERERAWRLASQRQLQDREAVNALWQQFVELRVKLAANAGFSDYRSFRWKQLLRFDYSPSDCMEFHRAIEQAVVPAAARICEKRRRLLGVDTLRPWDMEVDPFGRGPLTPFRETSELPAKASAIFHKVAPPLGAYFDIMVNEGLLDLDNRKNKAPGGYCIEFTASKRPFIFMNAVGVHDDVQTLLHEAGHAFHAFERGPLPYYQQRQVAMEFAEVASMAMELLAAPYLSEQEGGFYSPADAARARAEHLERGILFWPYMAVVDAFQHWVYENASEALNPSACDAQWRLVWERFVPWIDWSGLEDQLVTGWQRKLHIHTVPFYYVEYGLAQLGATQIWSNALRDQTAAVASYRKALALGGTVPLPDLYEAAGARLAFDRHTLASAVSLMEQTFGDLTED